MKTILRLLAFVNLAVLVVLLLFIVLRLFVPPTGGGGGAGCGNSITCYPILGPTIPIVSIILSAVIVGYKAVTLGSSGNRRWLVGFLILAALFALSFVLGQVGIGLPEEWVVVARVVLAGVASLISTALAIAQTSDGA